MKIGTVLRQIRQERRLSAAAVAEMGGVPRSYVSMVESGRRSPNPRVLARTMIAIGIPVCDWVPAFLEDERRCQRLVELGKALFDAGEYIASRDVLGRAYFMGQFEGEGRYNADIYHYLGRAYFELGRYIQALAWLRKLERASRHAPLSRIQGVARYDVGLALRHLGKPMEAIAMFDKAISVFSDLQLEVELGSAWIHKANTLLKMKRYEHALPAYRYAARWLEGNQYRSDALLGIAIVSLMLQGPEAALPLLYELVGNQETTQIVRVKSLGYIATALRWSRKYDEALSYVHSALELSDAAPSEFVASMVAEEALCYALNGNVGAARDMVAKYKQCEDDENSYDIAVMNIVAEAVGAEPVESAVPTSVEDGYERRLAAALELLRGP
jgi:tetratricopeptide (TPR) repeat protein